MSAIDPRSPATKGAPENVFFTNAHGGLGGGEIALLQHIASCIDLGFAAHLLVLEDGPFLHKAKEIGCQVHLMPFTWQGNKFNSLFLIASRVIQAFLLCIKFKPVLTYCYTHNDLVFFGLASRLYGSRVVWRSQGEIFTPQNPGGTSWLGSLFIPALRFIKPCVVATTHGDLQRMRSAGLTLPKMEVVFLGAKDHGPPPPVSIGAAAPVRIGIFGRLVRWKGQDVFIKAMGDLSRLGYKFEAIIVGGSAFGDGDVYESELRRMAVELGIQEQVQFLGHRSDVQDLMRSCHIICHCSEFEPFGMVIIEAMMAGRPVIASDLPGPRESVVNDDCGFLVPYGDYVEISKIITELITKPALADKISESARLRAKNLFDLEKNLERLNAYLSS
jgi:glycosyltransferase involved in cell wall biosynthesis